MPDYATAGVVRVLGEFSRIARVSPAFFKPGVITIRTINVFEIMRYIFPVVDKWRYNPVNMKPDNLGCMNDAHPDWTWSCLVTIEPDYTDEDKEWFELMVFTDRTVSLCKYFHTLHYRMRLTLHTTRPQTSGQLDMLRRSATENK